MNPAVWFLGGHHKNIDDVLAACIDERGDILAAKNVETRADQLKPFIGIVLHGRNKGELPVKPRFDGVLVGRSNIDQVAQAAGSAHERRSSRQR